MLWAYANVKASNPNLFKKVGDHIVALDNLGTFKPQELSNIVWAYATAGESHPKLFKKVSDHIVALDNLESFWPQALANIVWALATNDESHPKLFKKVADHIVALDNLRTFKPQELSNIAWAYATAGKPRPQLFKKIANHIAVLDHLRTFAPQALANIVWAYATADESYSELFKKVSYHIVSLDNLRTFKTQELSNIAWAYAKAKESNPRLFQKVAPVAASLLSTYNSQQSANIAWSYAVINVPAPSLFNTDFINACLEKERDFPLKGLAQLHQWNLWQEELESNVCLPASLQEKCYDAFVTQGFHQSAFQDNVISVLSSIGLEPEEEVLTKRGYRLDALVEVNGSKVGIEVDGPSHFVGRKPTGSTILKHRQVVRLEGISIVSVPYWEWNKLGKDNFKKQKYLRALLGLSSPVGLSQALADGLAIRKSKTKRREISTNQLNNANEESNAQEDFRGPDMRNCGTIGELAQMAYDHLDVMSPRDMSAFWTLAAKFLRGKNQRSQVRDKVFKLKLDTILAYTQIEIQSYDYRDLAQTTLGFAKIVKSVHGKRLLRQSPQQILQNIFISNNAETKQSMFGCMAKASMHVLSEFDARSLSNLIYAFGLAEYNLKFEDGGTLFDVLALEATSNIKGFEPQHLSNIVWAYANVKATNPSLFKKVGDHIVALDNLGTFVPQDLSNIAWAYATTDESHPKLFKKVSDHIVSLETLESFWPQALSNIMWAYATAKKSHPKLFRKVSDHIVALDDLRTFKPQELANIAWAYATAKESNPPLFQKVAESAITKQNEFNSQEIANLLWAYATNGQIDQQLFQSLAPIAASLFSSQEIANIAWSHSVANVPAPSLFNDAFINACLEKEREFPLEGLAQLHQWNLWQEELESNVCLPASLQEKCYDAFISRVPNASALQDNVISALSSIGLEPEEEVLTKGGYRLDALVEVNGSKVGIEVDGPSHFVGRKPTGSTILKHRQVVFLEGISIVSVPYWEWNKLGKDNGKKQEYLRALLGLS
ncbi:hypothetical protein ACHAXR_004948 [Thalassiosira sp. AJA248-18]